MGKKGKKDKRQPRRGKLVSLPPAQRQASGPLAKFMQWLSACGLYFEAEGFAVPDGDGNPIHVGDVVKIFNQPKIKVAPPPGVPVPPFPAAGLVCSVAPDAQHIAPPVGERLQALSFCWWAIYVGTDWGTVLEWVKEHSGWAVPGEESRILKPGDPGFRAPKGLKVVN